MKISICGPICSDNVKLTKEYIKSWGSYKISEASLIVSEKLNTAIDKDSLYKLLNDTIDDAMSYRKNDKILFSCNVIDILCKFFRLKAKDDNFVDDTVLQKVIHLTKQGLHFYDIIYFLPYLEKYNNTVFEDAEYAALKELNNFYLEIQDSYIKNSTWLFDFKSIDGAPALIEIFGNIDEQMQMIKLYLNNDGEAYGKDDSLIQQVINN